MPAGMRIPPGEDGCRTNKSKMRMITRHGNNRTKPRGMDIDELPFRRILRFRKANLEKFRAFSRELSSKGRFGVEGNRFEIR